MKFKASWALFMTILLTSTSCFKEKRSDNAGLKMQDFVIDISTYVRSIDPNFIVVPQNGMELAYNFLDINDGLNPSYLDAIDGFGVEELFYDGVYGPDPERLTLLEGLDNSKPVLVAEYLSDDNEIPNAILSNADLGYLCFPRANSNHDYKEIPTEVIDENDLNIINLTDAQNYLYLISTDDFASKQDMINQIKATNFDLIIMDLFFEEDELTQNEISQLKTKANGGSRIVISYINIGAAESYRYYWKEHWKLHRPNWLKKRYEGYNDEIWVKFWKEEWRSIIFGNENSYTKKIINAGFDGLYLDNVESYYFLYFD